MPFEPTLSDVLVVRVMLSQTVLLPELVGTILDYAEYWARSSAKAQPSFSIHAEQVGDGEFDFQGSTFLLRSFPIGLTHDVIRDEDGTYQTEGIAAWPVKEEYDRNSFQQLIRNTSIHRNPVRKIVFRIRSHDQGWTTDERTGPFIDAKTWFEVGLEKFDASHECERCPDIKKLPICKLRVVEPKPKNSVSHNGVPGYHYAHSPWKGPREILRNKVASREWTTYEVTWTCWDVVVPGSKEAQQAMEEGKGQLDGDGKFVRSLKMGDVVTVWGRAMHRGWVNVVDTVEINVYWAL
ncbi:hypothetical protein N5P37_006297 [Trichoderma harzianum]|uniref:Uncharacterized protein n=1 Tax=Trichoderma harzianum CBS 226.95 TaxID=983964 RepID=A0A2T4A9S2_TRIHA|nr:hypothetical protein M431DRAFT_508899 [Trichoderma harzianum CBS 226.95]KAK0761348.1 hypothetical protein N5P37_006297 [Trichoderma harzianum]PKK52616.1 hypothetical protein CI102_3249 [Trichoderma harzianum]PTB53840.1 hypothetical protein M431DRAFT_508899 [Trichoderma harzianum CBS 226.95]